MTEDKLVEWLNGHEFEQTLGNSEGRKESLVCCSPWGHKELDMTEQYNNNDINMYQGPTPLHSITPDFDILRFIYVCVHFFPALLRYD